MGVIERRQPVGIADWSGNRQILVNCLRMAPNRPALRYRPATQLERDFLRIVTFGYPELERQVTSCEIADYDVTGWCYLNVADGPPSPNRMMDGPSIDLTTEENATFQIARTAVPEPWFVVSAKKILKNASFIAKRTPQLCRVDIILWTDDDGMLYAVEVICYGDGNVDPYRLFVGLAKSEPSRLQYSTSEHR